MNMTEGAKQLLNLASSAAADAGESPEYRARGGGSGPKIEITLPTGEKVLRRDFIQALYANGMTRTQIVHYLKNKCAHETTFQVVFQATSKMENGKETNSRRGGELKMITLPDGTEIAQRDLIKQLLTDGKSRGGIVDYFKKELSMDIPYGTVYQVSRTVGENVGADQDRGKKKAEKEARKATAKANAAAGRVQIQGAEGVEFSEDDNAGQTAEDLLPV